MPSDELMRAHDASFRNRVQVLASTNCGCFYCLKVFAAKTINSWKDDGLTANCPHCERDAVIPDAARFPLTQEFLTRMNVEFFQKPPSAA